MKSKGCWECEKINGWYKEICVATCPDTETDAEYYDHSGQDHCKQFHLDCECQQVDQGVRFNSNELTKALEETKSVFSGHVDQLNKISHDIKTLEEYFNRQKIGVEAEAKIYEEVIDGETINYFFSWKKVGNERAVLLRTKSFHDTTGQQDHEKRFRETNIETRLKLHKYLSILVKTLAEKIQNTL